LVEAHEMLTHARPAHDAEPTVWVAFHRRAAQVYAHAAKVDLGHRHEANHWAGAEIRHAREIEHRLGLDGDDE
jgi:hypothetical protein